MMRCEVIIRAFAVCEKCMAMQHNNNRSNGESEMRFPEEQVRANGGLNASAQIDEAKRHLERELAKNGWVNGSCPNHVGGAP